MSSLAVDSKDSPMAMPSPAPSIHLSSPVSSQCLGMEEFFKSHKCNTLCQYLGLPMHNFKRQDSGTRANQLLSPKLSRKGVGPV